MGLSDQLGLHSLALLRYTLHHDYQSVCVFLNTVDICVVYISFDSATIFTYSFMFIKIAMVLVLKI